MDRCTIHVHADVDDLKFVKGCIRRKSVSHAAAATADVQDSSSVREEPKPPEFTQKPRADLVKPPGSADI